MAEQSIESSPLIHQQSLDSVDDHLTSLSLNPKIDTYDNNNGESNNSSNESHLDEIKNDENEETEESEVDIDVENVNQSLNVKSKKSRFPVRPDAEDCSFYLRTGLCKFGMHCKFNHPPNRKTQGTKVKRKDESMEDDAQNEEDESSDKEGQIDCKYVDRPGGCKFGKTCKFNHSRRNYHTAELNFIGLPIRPGEKECSYYMRNGSCKYGANCRYTHPDPTSVGGPGALPVYGNGGSIFSSNASQSTLAPWSSSGTLNESRPYVPLMYPPTQGLPPQPEWTAFQAPVYPSKRNMAMPLPYAMNNQPLDRSVYTHQQEQVLVDEFPERPGQPECTYFLKTGNCKYRSACKFDHPKSVSAKSQSCPLSDLGLPLRPGGSICSYYSRYGICKYGPACKYDHPDHPDPLTYSHSEARPASNVVDHAPDLGTSAH